MCRFRGQVIRSHGTQGQLTTFRALMYSTVSSAAFGVTCYVRHRQYTRITGGYIAHKWRTRAEKNRSIKYGLRQRRKHVPKRQTSSGIVVVKSA